MDEISAGRMAVSIIYRHADGSVSSEVYAPTWLQYLSLKGLLSSECGRPAYVRHIPADDIREWAPRVGRLGVVM